jgi:Ca-activated chloride channel family protein
VLSLTRLRTGDRFNIIQFNSRTGQLFEQARPVTPRSLAAAQAWVRGLRAGGGTEMASALNAALDARQHNDRVRQVVFLTDGSVGNESRLFGMISARLGDSRLFTVGIGSAPNSYFMKRAARMGRGTFTYIGDVAEVRDRMTEMFARLEHPLLTDIRIDWPGVDAQMWPARIPDLYRGEPLLVSARLGDLQGEVRVRGVYGGQPWSARLNLAGGSRDSGIARRWARDKIDALMTSLHFGADGDKVRAAVTRLALAHRLVSKYTSLVAVDVTPSRPAAAPLGRGAVPVKLPHGWRYAKVFGALPQTATPAPLLLHIAALSLLLALLSGWMHARRTRPA